MQTGLVIGTAQSSVKHASLNGAKLLVVQFTMADGKKPDGEPVEAIDTLGAGLGDTVLLTSDGKEIELLLKSKTSPVRWSVMGLPD